MPFVGLIPLFIVWFGIGETPTVAISTSMLLRILGSSADYQSVASLKAVALPLSDVTVEYLQSADALASFTSGRVAAWVRDPYTSQILRATAGVYDHQAEGPRCGPRTPDCRTTWRWTR